MNNRDTFQHKRSLLPAGADPCRRGELENLNFFKIFIVKLPKISLGPFSPRQTLVSLETPPPPIPGNFFSGSTHDQRLVN